MLFIFFFDESFVVSLTVGPLGTLVLHYVCDFIKYLYTVFIMNGIEDRTDV